MHPVSEWEYLNDAISVISGREIYCEYMSIRLLVRQLFLYLSQGLKRRLL